MSDWSLFYADFEYLEGLVHAKFNRSPNEYSFAEEEVNIAKELENQMLKVSAHFNNIYNDLQSKLIAFRMNLNSNTLGQSKSSKEKLNQEINNIQQTFIKLSTFCEENNAGVVNLLQLHDRETQNENEKLFFLFNERLSDFNNYSVKFASLLLLFNDCCKRARFLSSSSPSPQNKEGKKEVKRFFLRKEDLIQIKSELTKHLPVHFIKKNNFKQMGGKKAAEGNSEIADFVSISTLYFENPQNMEIYLNRLNQSEGVSGVRVRTYSRSKIGTSFNPYLNYVNGKLENEKPMTGFIDRKGKREKEVEKRKVELNYSLIFDYLKGSYHVNDYLKKLRNFSYTEKDFAKFAKNFSDIQSTIVKKKLKAIFSSQFDRTVYMEEDDRSLKISIDTNIRFFNEKVGGVSNFWQSHQKDSFAQSFDFPYAVLEIKSSRPGEEWLKRMVSSNLLRPVENFSKFLHGSAITNSSSLPYFPHWLNKFDNSLPFPNLDLSSNLSNTNQNELLNIEKEINEDQSDAMLFDAYENNEFADIVAKLGLNQAKEREEKQPWFIKFMYSIGYPILPDHSLSTFAKIDPKTYFSNERTLLKWISICLIIQAGGITLIKFLDLGFTSVFTGFSLVFASLLFMLYAIFQYKIRNYLIAYRQDDRFEDEYGPLLLYLVILVLVLVNGSFYFSESLIGDQYYY